MRGQASLPLPRVAASRFGDAKGIAIVLLALGFSSLAGLVAIPSPASAWVPHAPIVIVGNADFTGANGVTGGSGTPADPYIIEGWDIDGSANSGIEVYNTDAHFVIRDVYVHSSLIDAIFFYSVRDGRVENATVSGNSGAVYIQVSSNITVASSNVSFNVLDAVVLDWSSNVTVEGNEMWGNGDWGVFAYESDDLVMRNNTISNNGWAGIELDWTDRVLVAGNHVANNNMAGLIANETSNVTIIDNTFPDNDFNVDLTNSFDVLIRNNTIATSTSDGVTITGGARLTIEENNITGNGGGVLAVGTTDLLVRHNAFWGNTPQAADVAGANAWDDGYPSGGNFWSDYAGADDCSGPNQDVCPDPDGIGDAPYVIDADSQDRYPLMQPFVPGPPAYIVEFLPSLSGDLYVVPWGLNEAGDVVGWSWDGQRARPFLFTDAAGTTALPALAGRPNGTARDISDTGLIVGSAWDGYLDQPGRAVRWKDGAVQDLGVLGSGPTSEARGVNETGAVAGWSYVQTSPSIAHGFLYTDGLGMVDVTPSRDSGFASDVNEAGLVAGYVIAPGGFHAFRWAEGTLEDLGAATFANSYGFGINDAGQTAGCLKSATGSSERAGRYTTGIGWEVLGGGGDTNCAWRVNAYGDVVGRGLPTGGGILRAFLYTDQDGMLDLETLIDPALGLRLLDATDINDRGQIVGWAWSNLLVAYVGVRLTPTSPPDRMLIGASPMGLHVRVDGVDRPTPYSFPCIPGSFHQVEATSPQGTAPDVRYAFADWSDGGAQTHDIVCDPARTLTAVYRAQYLIAYDTSPTGLEVIEDGVSFSTPQQRWCSEGQSLAIGTASPQYLGVERYDFDSWSDGGAQFHTIACTAPATYIAAFLGLPYVTVISPIGGEDWTGGSAHSITWAMGDPEDPVLVVAMDLSIDGGAIFPYSLWSGALPVGPQSYAWALPVLDTSTARIRVCVADSDGGGACDASDADFAIDSTPPSVASVSPRDRAANVALGEPILVTFSEPMNLAAFPIPGISISPPVSGLTPSWSPDGRVLVFGHDPFVPCTTYTAMLDAGGSDVSDPGNTLGGPYAWSFAPVCPPGVELLAPRGGEEWTASSPHAIRFLASDDADSQLYAWINATLDGVTVTLYAGPVVLGETSIPWSVPPPTATAFVAVTVADSTGLAATAASGSFGIDGTPPALLGIDPPDGVTNVPVGTRVVLTFSEAMNTVSVEDAFSIQPSAPTRSYSWDESRRVLRVEFGSSLMPNTDYTATVGCVARDDSAPGNALDGCPVGGFRVQFRTEIVAAPPVAVAAAVPDARVGAPVTFDGRASTGEVREWVWTVATDAGAVLATLSGAVVSHTFAEPGTYRVRLVVTDGFGRTDEYSFDVVVGAVAGGEANAVVIAIVGAALLATALVASSEPGRVALMTATLARAYGRRRKDGKDPELRGAMLYYVRVHPGDCYMDIKRNLDLNDGVVTYHLARLEKEGLIRSAIRGARKRYYPAEMRVPLENGGELHEIQQRIMRFVGEAPGVPVAVLAEQLGVSNQLALYHLRKLSQGQRLELERAGLRLRAYPRRTEQ